MKGTGCFWHANQAASEKEYSKRKEFAPYSENTPIQINRKIHLQKQKVFT